MSASSTESRSYRVERKTIDGERFVEIAVLNSDGQIVTRDHFAVDEARSFAAEFILAVEG